MPGGATGFRFTPPQAALYARPVDPAEAKTDDRSSVAVWIACATASLLIAFLLLREPPTGAPLPKPPSAGLSTPTNKPSTVPSAPGLFRPRFLRLTGYTNRFRPDQHITYWLTNPPASILTNRIVTGERSNIHRSEYAGDANCRACHAKQHAAWTQHPHRLMNVIADEATVVGDFSGEAEIHYRGGTGRFLTEDGSYKMVLQRGESRWRFRVTRTIGSRFFQYYAGVAEDLPINASAHDPRLATEHVLPFGYWITAREWVPTVHVHRAEDRDDDAVDPYDREWFSPYDKACSDCHTTWSFADWIVKASGQRFAMYSPREVDIDLGPVLEQEHPDRYQPGRPLRDYDYTELTDLLYGEQQQPRPAERVSLGITCEACHLGVAEHARSATETTIGQPPLFFPVNPAFYSDAKDHHDLTGRTAHNVNFICSRCHAGRRPIFANGTHTWNSTEYSDAINGHCYHPDRAESAGMDFLTCVSCHDPHEPTGLSWRRTPAQDDQSCVRCHTQFATSEAQSAHSHHTAGTSGSHCMDCHMPKINEGLEEIVRTHTIQSPVDKAMVEANHPNACNLCHLEESIDWTLQHLREWFPGRHEFDQASITATYPDRSQPVGPTWLRSPHPGTRLAAGSMLARLRPAESLDALLDLLATDEQLINRQFVQRELLRSLKLDLKEFGYQFYQDRTERERAIERQRTALLAEFAQP